MTQPVRIVFSDIDGTIMHEPKTINRVWKAYSSLRNNKPIEICGKISSPGITGCVYTPHSAFGKRSAGEKSFP